jgi:hypothetical protein
MSDDVHAPFGIDLLWIPLGAGGSGWVRVNGLVYERLRALVERRRPLDLYHTALLARVPDGEYVIETVLPSPDGDAAARGVVVVGPMFSRWLGWMRLFLYEVRCWRDGVLPDAADAVGGPRRVSRDRGQAEALLDATRSIPRLVWGRDELGTGEMWNSNSVISWLLTKSGVPIDEIQPPHNGRGPGWDAGVIVAKREGAPGSSG